VVCGACAEDPASGRTIGIVLQSDGLGRATLSNFEAVVAPSWPVLRKPSASTKKRSVSATSRTESTGPWKPRVVTSPLTSLVVQPLRLSALSSSTSSWMPEG
jgi:hypothetical protein